MRRKLWEKLVPICICLMLLLGNISLLQVQASGDIGPSGTLDVMVNKTEEEMHSYQEEFEKRYPRVKLNYIYLEDYDNQAKRMMESGDYADVLFVPSFVSSSEYANYFEVLGDASELSQKYNYMDQSKRNGSKVYGIPSSAYVSGFLYNKSVFQKAGITNTPKSTGEFLEDMRYIKEYTDAVPFYTNYVSDWALNIWENYPFIEMTGDSRYKENVFVNEKNPYAPGSTHANVYQLLYDVVQQGLCEQNLEEISWEESKSMLNEGKIGCIAIGSWALSQFKHAGEHAEDIAFMPFPNEVDGKQYATISTDYCYAVNCKSENKDIAKLYIDFMVNDSGYALNNDTLSIVKSDPYPESYRDMKAVTLLSNDVAAGENKGMFAALSANLNLTDGKEQKRIMDAAAGRSEETMNVILLDWNERWESSRTEDMDASEQVLQFSPSDIQSEEYKVEFSEREQAYLEGRDKIKVGYLCNYAPFSYEKSGTFSGVAAELCDILSKQMNVPFEYHSYDSYEGLVEAMGAGEIELIAGMETISAFSDRIRLSKEYMDITNVIVKNKSVKLEQMEKKKAAVIQGNEADYFQNLENVVYEDTLEDAIEQVNQEDADYTIANNYSANYYIRQAELDNLVILQTTSQNGMYLGFSKDADTRFIAICNKCIYSIPDSRIEMMLLNNIDPPAQKLTLARWIKIHPIQSIICLSVVSGIIVLVILWIYRERVKSARKHELDARRYQILADLTNEYVFEYKCQSNCLQFDKKFSDTFGFDREVNLGSFPTEQAELNIFIQHFLELKEQEERNSVIFSYGNTEEDKVWYRLIVSRIYDNKKRLIQMIGKVVSAQQEVEERQQMLKKAERDPLTGLFNREGFQSIFTRLHKEHPADEKYVMAIMDMDNFKGVNDTLGHLGGDEALKLLAQELMEIFAGCGITARYGGDEFIVYFPKTQKVEEIHLLLEKLVTSMNRVLTYQQKDRMLSISLGAVVVENSVSMEQALKWADEVLYEVKQSGRNAYKLIEK